MLCHIYNVLSKVIISKILFPTNLFTDMMVRPLVNSETHKGYTKVYS
jgi:hypothetical protein